MFRLLVATVAASVSLCTLLLVGSLAFGRGQPPHVLAYTQYHKGIGFTDIDRRLSMLLTFNDLGSAVDLQWSPDGQKLTFLVYPDLPGDPDLYLLSLADLSIRNLSPIVTISLERSWSPDGRMLAFTARTSQGKMELQLVDVGSGEILTHVTHLTQIIDPSWSHDGQMLAFASGVGSKMKMQVLDIKTYQVISDLTQPIFSNLPQFWCWSPDSRWLLSTSFKGGGNAIVLSVIDLNSRQVRSLYSPGGGISSIPIWSPDSQYIAFSAVTNIAPGKLQALHIMNIFTGQDEIFEQKGAAYNEAIWSSDGQRLEFIDLNNHIVYEIDRSANQPQVLVPAQDQISGETEWSPDGQFLALTGKPTGIKSLIVLDVKTHVIWHVADNVISSPAWQP